MYQMQSIFILVPIDLIYNYTYVTVFTDINIILITVLSNTEMLLKYIIPFDMFTLL